MPSSDLPNKGANIGNMSQGTSTLPKDKGPTPTTDPGKAVATKRQNSDTPSSPGYHNVYVRRKVESEHNKVNYSHELKGNGKEKTKEQEAPLEDVQHDDVTKPQVASSVAKPVEPSPVDKPVEPSPVDKPIEASPIDKPIEASPVDKPIEASPVDKPIEASPVEKPIEASPVEKPIDASPVEKPIDASLIDKPIEASPIDKPIEASPIDKPIEASPIDKPIEASPVEEPVAASPVEEPMEASPVEKHVDASPVQKSLEASPVEKPVEAPPVEKPLEASPVEKPVEASPFEKPVEVEVSSISSEKTNVETMPEKTEPPATSATGIQDDAEQLSIQYWNERFTRLQTYLENCDRSTQEGYLRKLRSLSAAGRSMHAIELEKRAIHLLVEEGKELQRMKALNVLGKVSPNASSKQTPSQQQLHK